MANKRGKLTNREMLRRLRQQMDSMSATVGILEKIEAESSRAVRRPAQRKGQRISLDDHLDDHERSLIVDALNESHGVQLEAARLLGIGRDRLRYKMAKYGLL